MTMVQPEIVHVHEMDAVIASPAMRALMAMVERVSPGNAAILITGETGTGKELIARAIHSRSMRAAKPWVDVNCAALPEHLVESELFGYEKGAFSGADTLKPGMFELADKGTLFLDEVGELDPRVQVKLLRVLDNVPYYRLGGSRKVSVDVRVIAATNQPLDEAVKNGKFRGDLYHRLGQLQLRVPPLRERIEEIAILAQHFLGMSYPGMRFTMDALDALEAYPWPGNVRELRNVVLQSAVGIVGEEIDVYALPADVVAGRKPVTSEVVPARAPADEKPAGLDQMEREAIIRALSRTGGHQGLAAEQLGISRRTLSRKLKQYGVEGRTLGALGRREERYFRVSLSVPVSVVSRQGEQVVSAENVSEGGMAVKKVSDPALLTGGLRVVFAVPGQTKPIAARAQVVWSDAQGRAGLRFTSMDDGCSLHLRQWLRERQTEEGWLQQDAASAGAQCD